jgi:hypothetical protein
MMMAPVVPRLLLLLLLLLRPSLLWASWGSRARGRQQHDCHMALLDGVGRPPLSWLLCCGCCCGVIVRGSALLRAAPPLDAAQA